jgi:DNA-directed RNA polymerase subunit RPC12/RpoP
VYLFILSRDEYFCAYIIVGAAMRLKQNIRTCSACGNKIYNHNEYRYQKCPMCGAKLEYQGVLKL